MIISLLVSLLEYTGVGLQNIRELWVETLVLKIVRVWVEPDSDTSEWSHTAVNTCLSPFPFFIFVLVCEGMGDL